MKRLIQILTVFCFFACLIGTAFADVLYVPDDDFLRSHPSDYEGRSYIVNASSGFTGVYQDPEQQEPIAYAENDSVFFVSYIYLNGSAAWGLVDWTDLPDGNAQPGYGKTGWILLSDCYRRYDSQSFLEEYGSQMKTDSAAVQSFQESLGAGQELQFYAFPGSDRITSTLPVDESSIEEIRDYLVPDQVFTDENELVWCHIGYFWGRRDWLCLSDPTNKELPVVSRGSIPVRYPAETPSMEPASPSTGQNTGMMALAGVLVAVLAVLSGVLIHFLGRKKSV